MLMSRWARMSCKIEFAQTAILTGQQRVIHRFLSKQ